MEILPLFVSCYRNTTFVLFLSCYRDWRISSTQHKRLLFKLFYPYIIVTIDLGAALV